MISGAGGGSGGGGKNLTLCMYKAQIQYRSRFICDLSVLSKFHRGN